MSILNLNIEDVNCLVQTGRVEVRIDSALKIGPQDVVCVCRGSYLEMYCKVESVVHLNLKTDCVTLRQSERYVR